MIPKRETPYFIQKYVSNDISESDELEYKNILEPYLMLTDDGKIIVRYQNKEKEFTALRKFTIDSDGFLCCTDYLFDVSIRASSKKDLEQLTDENTKDTKEVKIFALIVNALAKFYSNEAHQSDLKEKYLIIKDLFKEYLEHLPEVIEDLL